MGWESLAAYAGIAGMFLFAVIAIVLHVFPTGYNPLRNPLSDYATGSFRALMAVAYVLLGIGVLLLTFGLAAGLGAGKRVALGVFLIGVFGASRLLVAFFPSDVDGADRTAVGRIHSWLSGIGFTALPLAAIALTPVFERVYTWASVASPLHRLELLVVVIALVLLITRIKAFRVVFGLLERLFYASSFVWLFVLALHFALLKH